tara:strand:- start:295 stop:1065 length:771 start_codon:yes stop_codon:yes gene_type:complete
MICKIIAFLILLYYTIYFLKWVGLLGDYKKYSYRLGDMVKSKKQRGKTKETPGKLSGKDYHLKNFPNSIASEYLRRTDEESDLKILIDIIDERISYDFFSNLHLVKDHAIIHLRIGDVVDQSGYSVESLLEAPKPWKSKWKKNYVKPLAYYRALVEPIKSLGFSKVLLVGGFHKKGDHTKSHEYVSKVEEFLTQNGFECTKIIDNDPDDDFILMSSAKLFIPSGGGYSDLVKDIVTARGGLILPSEKDRIGLWEFH